jgi:hypothetical protein
MIVSVRQWTFLRPVRQMLHALSAKAPAQSRVEEKPKSFLGQFEEMMSFQTGLVIRGLDKD